MARTCPTCPSVLSGPDARCPIHGAGVDAADPFVGRTLGGFRVANRLHAERGGVWYRALDDASRRYMLLVGYGDVLDDGVASRAAAEAERATQLVDPQVAKVVDDGRTEAGAPYLIYEQCDGQVLGDLIEHGGAFDLSRAVKTLRAICRGYATADAWELPHHGLTPQMVVLDGERTIVVGFGASQLRAASPVSTDAVWFPPEDRPEPSFTHDVYSLGAIFHALLFGEPPSGAPRPLVRAPELGQLMARMLSADRGARPTSIDEVFEGLVDRPRPRLASDLSITPETGVNTYILTAGAVREDRVAVEARGIEPHFAHAARARADTAPMPSGTFNDRGAAGVAPLPEESARKPQRGAAIDRADTTLLPRRPQAAPQEQRRVETLVVRPRGLSNGPTAVASTPIDRAPTTQSPLARNDSSSNGVEPGAAPLAMGADGRIVATSQDLQSPTAPLSAAALDAALDDLTPPRRWPWILAVVAVFGLAAGAWVTFSADEPAAARAGGAVVAMEDAPAAAANGDSRPEDALEAPSDDFDPPAGEDDAPLAGEDHAPPDGDDARLAGEDAAPPDGDDDFDPPLGEAPADPPPIEPVAAESDGLPQGDAPPIPRGVTLRIRSSPPGAKVYLAKTDVMLGETPLEIRRRRAKDEMAFELRMVGFESARRTLALDRNGTLEVELERRVRKRRTRQIRRSTSQKKKSLERGTLLDPFAD